ncbi:MAG: hypothetical protein HOP29_06970 [Phycisphaerales bacterium]|nr:hypothetical protein [Phycisphaerales bacterium]
MSSTADEIYARQIGRLTDEEKLRLVELIAHELGSRNGGRSVSEPLNTALCQAARDRFRRHAGAVSLGHATGADNERIDADLGREYGSGLESP